MKIPTKADLDWLDRSRRDPDVAIHVVINGYPDEITDWLGGALMMRGEIAALRRAVEHAKGLERLAKIELLQTAKERDVFAEQLAELLDKREVLP